MRDLVDAERASCDGEPPADYDVFEFRRQDRVRQRPRSPPLRRSNCLCGARMCNHALTHVCLHFTQVIARARFNDRRMVADLREPSPSNRSIRLSLTTSPMCLHSRLSLACFSPPFLSFPLSLPSPGIGTAGCPAQITEFPSINSWAAACLGRAASGACLSLVLEGERENTFPGRRPAVTRCSVSVYNYLFTKSNKM